MPRQSRLVSQVSSLRSEPLDNLVLDKWMTNLPTMVRNTPINMISIPGSHDAGSYGLIPEMGFSPDRKWVGLDRVPFMDVKATKTFLKKWFKTQRIEILEQLNNGIRYIDLRVAPWTDDDFYFVHGLYSEKISTILAQVKSFLLSNPKEVVLLDFQHLHDMTKAQHEVFISDILLKFGKMICPFVRHRSLNELTLEDLAAKGYQILMFYGNEDFVQRHPELWSRSLIPNPWANTESMKKLIPFLWEGLVNRDSEQFFVSQGILSPRKTTVIRHPTSSLFSYLARRCNKGLEKWLLDVKKTTLKPNVVMIDYVDYADYILIKLIILINYEYITL